MNVCEHIVFLGLGSNMGNRDENIRRAISLLSFNPNIEIEKISSIIETEPEGYINQNKFLNGVVKIRTGLSPYTLLREVLQIENVMGRRRVFKNGPRIIDIDILLYDEEIIDSSDLVIPHPRMWYREFVLKPLFEIEPDIWRLLKTLELKRKEKKGK